MEEEVIFDPVVHFDRKAHCDWCGCEEVCGITHFGTSHYNRLICVECCLDLNQQHRATYGEVIFDLNNSTIKFPKKEEE